MFNPSLLNAFGGWIEPDQQESREVICNISCKQVLQSNCYASKEKGRLIFDLEVDVSKGLGKTWRRQRYLS